ncbi:MAG: hypothetical protein H6981_06185 [Gammaproteobacteria bacterium]|nr:hypothetical protein [Gammaproteobacteria bacterium]MCP5136372.1 hypothetical protein [Gammaproteobacteria bacterium]
MKAETESQKRSHKQKEAPFVELVTGDLVSSQIKVPAHEFTGASLIEAAKLDPAPDLVLLALLTSGGIETIRASEIINVAAVQRIYVGRGDRTWRFTLNNESMEWASETISETVLRHFVGGDDDVEIVIRQNPDEETVLEQGTSVSLDGSSIETFHSRRVTREITVYYNNDPFEGVARVYGVGELRTLFAVPEGFVFEVIRGDGEFVELNPNQHIRLKDGMQFVSHAPYGVSS